MSRADYEAAFRFGFGLNAARGERFDPQAELRDGIVPDAAASDELANALADYERSRRELAALRKANAADFEHRKKQANRAARRLDAAKNHEAIMAVVHTHTPFLRRLSAFWVNHFAIGRIRLETRLSTGWYEAVAIWPNLLGNFADLLIAAELYPAMVDYLNLQTSIGPNSPQGKATGKGINENLGREILELHTLGADGGYAQADVVALAMIMTGWHVALAKGRTVFSPRRAEPGVKVLLGQRFGEEGGRKQYHDALRMLAQHPSTARHLGRKLALHFFGPGSDAEAAELARVYVAHGGELKPVYQALLDLGHGKPAGNQIRNDYQFVISALRSADLRPGALGLAADNGQGGPAFNPLTTGAMAKLTQRPWAAPSPEGWPDDPDFWLSPSVLAKRLQWIPALVKHVADKDPILLLANALGPLASANTERTIGLASNRLEAMGLVYASPEFSRR